MYTLGKMEIEVGDNKVDFSKKIILSFFRLDESWTPSMKQSFLSFGPGAGEGS